VTSSRGFSLIEITIAVGIVAAVAIGGLGFTLGSRSLQVSSAALQFDTLLAAARRSASVSRYGETIAVAPDAFGDGFVARVYENRPGTVALVATTMPELAARVAVTETQTLGTPSFALTVHANGSVGGIAGDPLGSAARELPCPASGTFHLVFSYALAQATRDVPCSITLATTGPPVLATLTPAVPLPLPTAPCTSAGCPTPSAAATPVPVAIYFAGPSAVRIFGQAGGVPHPCASYPLYDRAEGATADSWSEDDWYLETITTTAGAFIAQHVSTATGSWSFTNDSFGVPGGTYLDPTVVGEMFLATGTYQTGTTIPASAVAPSVLGALPPATPVLESDYLHWSCYAEWSGTPDD
jgi:type II secretory pathway pseudopilin PulG